MATKTLHENISEPCPGPTQTPAALQPERGHDISSAALEDFGRFRSRGVWKEGRGPSRVEVL